MMREDVLTKADTLLASAVVWDQCFPATDGCGSFEAHCRVLRRMKSGGYTAVSLTMAYDPESTLDALHRIALWRRFLLSHPDEFILLATADDAVRPKAERKLAVGFHFLGTTSFARDLALVESFHALGVRQAILAYNQNNNVGVGCHEMVDSGLSRFGCNLVAEMQRVGILVDCSHTGHRTAMDAFEIATAPMIYSHSDALALHDHQRNIPDALAKACVATGSMVGATGVGIFVGGNNGSAEGLFRHVDQWVQLLGARHVGLGLDVVSDMQVMSDIVRANATKWPADQNYHIEGMNIFQAEQLAALVECMLRAGYGDEDVRGVLGGNWLRLARETWSAG
jgi:membrane dipeptidase